MKAGNIISAIVFWLLSSTAFADCKRGHVRSRDVTNKNVVIVDTDCGLLRGYQSDDGNAK